MEGFEPRWADFPDYIIGITREIWEGRGIHRIRDWYAEDVIFRNAAGIARGNASVIAGTLATAAEFPDRKLMAEDVVWCGTPETGMLSSHRLVCTATHSGPGAFGPPTGRRVTFRAIADCHARGNRIDDEWLLRDQGAICRQLGQNPEAFARAAIAREGGPENARRPFTPDQDIPGPYRGRGNESEWGRRHAETLRRIMAAEVSAVREDYDRACHLSLPGGVTAHGHDAAERFWIALRAAFPSARFTVAHAMGHEDPLLGARAALRWSLDGRHEGWGPFGAPSGAAVHVMGFTHAEFGPRGVRREVTLYDETAVWKQILIAKGAEAAK